MKQANAKQKKWMSDIAEWANDNLYILYGDEYKESGIFIELHHVTGRSAKQNKVAIGFEFVIPVPFELHNVMSDNRDSVTHYKKNFVKRFGTQRSLFEKMVNDMELQDYAVPDSVIQYAIQDTSA
jgi:hypothetical protein